MARTSGRKTTKAGPAARGARPAAKKRARRYAATPSGTSDREHLIGLIRSATGCTARAARETLDGVLGTIGASLKKNQKVQLSGFGSFVVSKRRAHKGRNPRTGEAIRVKASKTIRFRPGRPLKRSVWKRPLSTNRRVNQVGGALLVRLAWVGRCQTETGLLGSGVCYGSSPDIRRLGPACPVRVKSGRSLPGRTTSANGGKADIVVWPRNVRL